MVDGGADPEPAGVVEAVGLTDVAAELEAFDGVGEVVGVGVDEAEGRGLVVVNPTGSVIGVTRGAWPP